METYFIVLTSVFHIDSFDAYSEAFVNYPSEQEIKEEMERLIAKGFVVYSARVEKRYKLKNT
jgi:anaerobic ribonucleoside-triphosphate reductase